MPVLGRRSTAVTLGSICIAIGLTFFSTSWLVWTFLLVAMTLVMGPRHPRTVDEDIPLDRARIWLAVVALVDFRHLLHSQSDRAEPDCLATR